MRALLLTAAIVVAGCSDDAGSSTDPGPTTATTAVFDSLDGREFAVEQIRVGDADLDLVRTSRGEVPVVRFDADRLSASVGCNDLGGAYSIREQRLVVPEVYGSQVGCRSDHAAIEAAVGAVLSASPTVAPNDVGLLLTSGESTILLREI